MNHTYIINELHRNKNIFNALLSGVQDDVIKWKVQEDKWCLLEIVCHLYDEEREDFRTRVKHILEQPDNPMPPIDPQGWVTSRNYIEQDYLSMLDKFITERSNSIEWLQSLNNPSWQNTHLHPRIGPMSAGMVLANWLAHDYHHIRQVNAILYYYHKEKSGQGLDYAGNW